MSIQPFRQIVERLPDAGSGGRSKIRVVLECGHHKVMARSEVPHRFTRCAECTPGRWIAQADAQPVEPRPARDGQRPHLSPSRLKDYFSCGEYYRRRHVEQEHAPPGWYALRGTGMHEAAKYGFRAKMRGEQLPTPEQFADLAVAAAEARLERDGMAAEEGEDVDSLKASTAQVATAFARQTLICWDPILVEEEIRLTVPGCQHDLYGIVDLVDRSLMVPDFKSKKATPSEAEARSDLGLTYYVAATTVWARQQGIEGERLGQAALDVIVTPKVKAPYRRLVETVRTSDDFRALWARTTFVSEALAKGNFPPADPSSWRCSAKYCPFFASCRFAGGV